MNHTKEEITGKERRTTCCPNLAVESNFKISIVQSLILIEAKGERSLKGASPLSIRNASLIFLGSADKLEQA